MVITLLLQSSIALPDPLDLEYARIHDGSLDPTLLLVEPSFINFGLPLLLFLRQNVVKESLQNFGGSGDLSLFDSRTHITCFLVSQSEEEVLSALFASDEFLELHSCIEALLIFHELHDFLPSNHEPAEGLYSSDRLIRR